MPIPKSKQKKYGLIVGHLQNLGFSRAVAKRKADKAIHISSTKKKKK